jgi:ABC-type antimicrobial peptide transport system permease subunit
VLLLVLRKGTLLILMGILFGVAGAYAVGKLLIAVVPSLPTREPIAVAITSCVLVAVALVACYIPARRATKVDPLVALRDE